MKNTQPFTRRIIDAVGSRPFFLGIVALLVLQAAWIALSGLYPMAFDEDFHLGIIRLYAEHLNPFWSGQVVGGDAFGAVARDPSYLYHYLMSFPYKLASAVTPNLHAQVLFLRAINIALFAAGLFIYRHLLLSSRASKVVVNLCLLVFVLIPVVPLVAAQINYDNLFIPLTGLALLLTLKLKRSSQAKKLDVGVLLLLLGVCLFTCLVKYAFLPIFATIGVYTLVFLYKKYRTFRHFLLAVKSGAKNLNRWALILLVAINLLLGGLFIERYGVNLIRYHTPVADCAEVLDYDHCKYYDPWVRDYNFKLQKTDTNSSPITFSYEWARGMWLRSFFAVDGPTTHFQTRGPLTLPGIGALIFTVIGVAAFIITAKKLWKKYDRSTLWLMAWVSLIYLAILWIEEYRMYIETGHAVAINGRYLLPVLPFLMLIAALSVKELLDKRVMLQFTAASVMVLCFAWGGGALTYVLRSNDAWYWHDQGYMNSANHVIRQTIGPVTPGYNHPTQYMR